MPDRGEDWQAWLDRHGAALVLFARQWVDCRSDAEDLVQEAFVRFWQSRDRASEPLAYLYACVKHVAFDLQRSSRRRLRREERFARPELEPMFADAVEQAERRLAIEDALCTLPENQREVLVMKIWGGLSFPQIGAALCISPNTAASRYHYALAKLRQKLAKEVFP
jgi:RNA polymerase sigma-70 factor, ECF subfamily